MLAPIFYLLGILALLAELVVGCKVYGGGEEDASLRSSYDYIVVGCGISGLVVTNRLSEDESVTVLCIEAGLADNYEAVIQDPVYVGADIGGKYDWNLATVPQMQLDGAARAMPQGKALGGGSILNAMCWNRGGKDDYDAWEALGNPGWNWEGLLPYFMKSETYTPVHSRDIARRYSISYNPTVHGKSGPVQVSYPKYFYPQSINLFAGLNSLGVPTEFDPNDGSCAGAAFVPTDLHPQNQTRSDARRAYFDPAVSRKNLHVITGQHVTRVLINNVAGSNGVSEPISTGNENGNGNLSGASEGLGFSPGGRAPVQGERDTRRRDTTGSSRLRIGGVEFAESASAPRQTVHALREVIIAGGALHSAQILQLSGIGPAPLLRSFGIPLAIELPGVGNNLQDHCLVGTFYPYNNRSYPSPTDLTSNATFNTEAEIEYKAHKTGPWTAGSPNGLAFPPLSLVSRHAASIIDGANRQDPTEYLAPGLDASIVFGYAYQKNSLVQRLSQTNVAAYEIINNNAGSLTVSIMHPFSRGTCFIKSTNPFEPPLIDPRWLSNPVDRQILVEALLFNRKLLATPPMMELQPAQFVPPLEADENALNEIINGGIRTEFHPSGTCAMLPLDKGGVVDPHLRVWGTENLRIVDASIFPLVPAAHLQAVVYGVAEKAADIIKADNVVSPPTDMKLSPSYFVTTAVSTSRDGIFSSALETRRNASAYTSLQSLKSSFISRLSPKISSRPLRPSYPTGEENIPSSSLSLTISEATVVLSPSHSSFHLPTLSLAESGRTIISTVSILETKTVTILPSTPVSATHTTIANTLNGITLYHSSITLGPDDPPPIDESHKISKAVDAILPIIHGSNDGSTRLAAMETKQEERLKQRAALAILIRWLLSFFRIEVD